jgi:uncharacterized protein
MGQGVTVNTRGSSVLVGLLLAATAAPAAERPVGAELAIAIESANLARVKELVEGGASPDTLIEYDERKITPLMKASWDGRRDIAKYLISKGASVNAKGQPDGETALGQAIVRGFDDVIELLLASGADVRAQDARGNSPFALAMFDNQYEVAEMLLKAGADLDAPGTAGMTPLLTAASMGNEEALQFLLGHGAKVNKIGQLEYGGQTALTSAAGRSQVACVKALLAAGADPHIKMQDGRTALSMAQETGNQEVIALLKEALAKPPARAPARPRSTPAPSPKAP